jgi:hypothetical protein
MKKKVAYRWHIDLLEGGEWLTHTQGFRTLKEALDYSNQTIDTLSPTEYHELSLSRIVYEDNEEQATEEIGYAIVEDNKLPEVFCIGYKVPQEYKEELDRHRNDILLLMIKGNLNRT